MLRNLFQKVFGFSRSNHIYQTSFGELFFVNGVQKYYEGDIDKENTNLFFNLIVDVENQESFVLLLPQLEKLIESITVHDMKAKRFSADELVEVYNSEWKSENIAKIDNEEFIKQMKLSKVFVRIDGTFSLEYSVGKLLNGHTLKVEFSSNADIFTVDLERDI